MPEQHRRSSVEYGRAPALDELDGGAEGEERVRLRGVRGRSPGKGMAYSCRRGRMSIRFDRVAVIGLERGRR